ncbi:porin family protein [Flavobacterium circumlabens]|uniref:Outer membrane protein with beta-barrel domain n=1 Tax=Flavobacterium circumlabens TaxID=2133765 RepID=A0A4Y7UH70_9FLAO|nr:outer membrane beta-barrel protein [Flavobacterium circumlabens]TCN60663.1 outer membrane protein with beta-barrel domain [Flavobacterium circumlabens]TEB45810.1 porin family protein [Flavobacterium circumlabens]
MKKMLLILALATTSFANAQKGTILVGGNIGYSSENANHELSERKSNSFSFSPKVGYQFHDNWTVGGEFGLYSSKFVADESESKDDNFKLGAFVRYSVPLSETFSVFADLGAGFQKQKQKNYTNGLGTSTSKADGIYAGITPALFINMKKGFGLNFSIGGLGYETLTFDTSDTDVNKFYFNFGKTVNIGVSKNF